MYRSQRYKEKRIEPIFPKKPSEFNISRQFISYVRQKVYLRQRRKPNKKRILTLSKSPYLSCLFVFRRLRFLKVIGLSEVGKIFSCSSSCRRVFFKVFGVSLAV